MEAKANTVYSNRRVIQAPDIDLHPPLRPNERLKMDGLRFLSLLPPNSIPVAFLDPQYRGVLDKLSYGNEGKNRGKRRSALMQMDEKKIAKFVQGIDKILIPSGHLFLWMNEFHLCQGFKSWLDGTRLDVVDLIVWDKERFGKERRVGEYCVVLQKRPRRAKGVWKIHTIRDVWREKISSKEHPHQKPIGLQAELIAAVSDEGDYVIDPAAGSFSVMESAYMMERNFIGCDSERMMEAKANTVSSSRRVIQAPDIDPAIDLYPSLRPNERLKMDGLHFLSLLPPASIPVAFLDPQYRGVLDKLSYGNEGQNRGKRRSALMQMDEKKIAEFVQGIDKALIPSGHLFLWMDKFHLCQGFKSWLDGTQLDVVDLIVWDKERFGMGYRSRRVSEYCVVLQKQPRRAKSMRRIHTIRDVWREKTSSKEHPHQKPIKLQAALIAAVSSEGDYVIDPAAGSFSVMEAAHAQDRNFIGCDLEG